MSAPWFTEIGQIGNQKVRLGKSITVAMIQSLTRSGEIDKIANSFGTIIIDECHHIPAKSFREAFDYKIDKYETISRIMIHDTQINSLIIDYI
ncbi:MAG: DEAD/DEAH box helicase family protein [Bacteroidia bacterium]|nr:DEAD/DEAH box helicase family protein [Bacteroidia bacterium]